MDALATFQDVDAAFRRVCEGYVEPSAPTWDASDALWSRLAAEGRIVSRHSDGAREPYRVHLALVEHPSLPDGQVFSLFWMGGGSINVYRCSPEDARAALGHHAAFNL